MTDLFKDLTYEDAMEMLTSILEKLEEGSVPIDQLESTIDKANDLVTFCQEKLRQISEKLASKVKVSED